MENLITFHLDGPVVMIHKGWQTRDLQLDITKPTKKADSTKTSVHEPLTAPRDIPKRRYAFVNSTKPGRGRDSEERKRIRRHVRNEFVRLNGRKADHKDGKALGRVAGTTPSPTAMENRPTETLPVSAPMLLGYATETCSYPIDMSQETHALLSHYLTYASKRMFPIESRLKSNPFRSPEWLHFAVTDSAMFHAVLYSAAVYLALVAGKRESKETIYHQNRTVEILRQRLGDSDGCIADSTLGATSCLAIGEAISGNENLWRLHMKGLKNMMLSRRSLSSLSPLMMSKLRRSDITGAIDYATAPLLQFERHTAEPTWSIIPKSPLEDIKFELSNVLTRAEVDPEIINTMVELAYFTQVISLANSRTDIFLNPTTFSEDLYWIEHSLLSISKPNSEERTINRACRLGALLYLKGILQEFPHSATGASILTNRLRDSLDEVYMTEDNVHLLAWLAMIGAMTAKNGDRTWFIIYSNQSTLLGGIQRSDGALLMSRYLDLKTAFGSALDKTWNEILRNRSLVDFSESHPRG
ncbi:uncharacterized protein LY89DRAFT_781373 [Mollisia scopiformis]|uniref:Uncharacterized protein n=1 Tax=Mollisia scopiformis TaxID=149040 RepID=A0A194XEV8_MOLSC|nr:uncharacterized protein LY89DRAFT_781373 [Mollisia scopiformis]KUJ18302.1 hypothetical protein LY89DRAFT_781373 [Mollisia scopiformis]